MFERIKALFIKEFLQVSRDPRMKTAIFIAPLMQIMVFGFAATSDVRNIPTAVYDLDNTPQSREIIRQFVYSKYFNLKYYILSDEEQEELVDKSRVNAILRFNRGFARDILAGRPAEMQIVVDGTDSNTATLILSYANSIIERYSYRALQDRAKILLNRTEAFPSVDLKTRAWFNENLESRNFYMPGVMALILTLTSLLLTAMAIVREKEIGTIEQLIVSPVKPYELIIGKLMPFAVIGLLDFIFVLLIAFLLFKVPMHGSVLLLFAATLIYILTSLAAGLLISTFSATQQEALMSTFLFFFPTVLLSGFMFPIANMPEIVQQLTYANPLRYFMTVLRGIFLKGVGLDILWPDMLILFLMGVSILVISSLRFHKRLG